MTKTIMTLMILFVNNLIFSQNDSLADILIRYSNDRTVTLSGYKKSLPNADSTIIIDARFSLDTLIKYYNIKADFIPDIVHYEFTNNHIELDSTTFSNLLIQTKLKMSLVKYGYGGAVNYDDLSKKYGVKYYAGGCVYDPSDIDIEYSIYMRRLLSIRNGQNWEEHYNKEARKRH